MEEWELLNSTCQHMSKALSHMNTAKVEMEGIFVFVCVLTHRGHIKPNIQHLLSPAVSVWENFQSVYTKLFLLIVSLFYFSLKISQATNKVV